MSRTNHTFSLLQAVAAIAGLAILLWSLGLPSLRFAEAANVTNFSDTLSDSAPSVGSNHTITFTTPAGGGVGAGENITITFDNGFDLSSIATTSIDLATSTDYDLVDNGTQAGQEWGVLVGADSITFTSADAVIGENATVTIEIGTNATHQATSSNQITNPAVGSYKVNVTAGSDTGETRVAIVDNVTVSAQVDTTFQFQIQGLAAGVSVNGTSTTGSSSPTAISYGQLEAGVASTAGQQLDVTTNASNGFVVTVQADSNLLSSTGADIDTFSNGTNVSTPTAWTPPSGTLGNENTYGHWGVTTADATTGESLTDEFGDQEYVAVSTSTPVEVFRHNGPADGSTANAGRTEVAYTVQITSLQEAGDDYSATLTYVATPVF